VTDSKAMARWPSLKSGPACAEDVLFVSIDNTIADQADSPLSSVELPFAEMGRTVARQALEAEAQPTVTPGKPLPLRQICLQPLLVERTALGDEGTSNSTNPSAESSMS